MVADLHLPLEIVGVPTVREPDGLALSSRNRFLSAAERSVAPRLHAVLHATARELEAGAMADDSLATARAALGQAGFVPDYLALVDGPTLVPLPSAQPGSRLITAARLGSVRLIDNVKVA